MNRLGVVSAVAMSVALASCATRPAPAPAPEPPRPVVVTPPPQPAPPPPIANWQDAPLTPGDWSYAQENGISIARYGRPGAPSFVVRCEPGRQVSLTRTDAAAASALTIRTSSTARTVPARGSMAMLPAADPLLDAIAFSRGRFAVEAAGHGTLVIPTWPEAARVIEDCRA